MNLSQYLNGTVSNPANPQFPVNVEIKTNRCSGLPIGLKGVVTRLQDEHYTIQWKFPGGPAEERLSKLGGIAIDLEVI